MAAGKAQISIACLQDGYPHLAKSPSYSNGGNLGYGSLGRPPDPELYDEGMLVHPVGVLIQSEPAIGAERTDQQSREGNFVANLELLP